MYYGMADGDGPDVVFHSGDGVPKCDRSLLYHIVGSKQPPGPMDKGQWQPSLLDELVARGYDLSTLRFSIKKKG